MTVARFEHVSPRQYARDMQLPGAMMVEDIPLPRRATRGSAGYDFTCPAEVTLAPGAQAIVPTGIRVHIEPGWVLLNVPRSSLGRRHGIRLANTVGVIDSDYYGSDNEGHIQVKLTNDSREGKTVEVEAGTGFSQGIFVEYGITVDDEADEVRNGGFGSTTRA